MVNLNALTPTMTLNRNRLTPVLVPSCCCENLPETYWLKILHIYSLTVLEIRSLEWVFFGYRRGVSRAVSFWKLWRRTRFLALPSV